MRGWQPGSHLTPSPTGDDSCKDVLYDRFADLLLEVWEDGSLGALVDHVPQGMLCARTYCTLDLLIFSLRYERMVAWEPSYTIFHWGPIHARTYCTLDLLTFSLRYERMVSRESSYTISCRWVSTLSTSISTWKNWFLRMLLSMFFYCRTDLYPWVKFRKK